MKGECGCVLVCRVGREKSQERAQVDAEEGRNTGGWGCVGRLPRLRVFKVSPNT